MSQQRSIYNAGASDGLIMGLYLTAVFVIQVIGAGSALLMLLSEVMTLSVPVLAYVLLRREYRMSRGMLTFSAVWMHGIMIFLCGSLILALIMYIYMRYINITFIADQFQMLSETLREIGTPEAVEQADIYDKVLQKHLVPSPIYVSVGFIWLVSFSGAMLSIVLSLLVRALNRNAVTQE